MAARVFLSHPYSGNCLEKIHEAPLKRRIHGGCSPLAAAPGPKPGSAAHAQRPQRKAARIRRIAGGRSCRASAPILGTRL